MQVRCLIETPRVVLRGQILKGRQSFQQTKGKSEVFYEIIAEKFNHFEITFRQSYDVYIEMEIDGVVISNTLDLKNPYFRYTGQAPQPPPGHHTSAPSDAIWATTPGATENGGAHVVKGMTTVVDAMGNLVEMPTAHPVMSVLPSGVGNMVTNF